jgi:HAD superfamily hydrolase (TIGR01509 family)
MRVGQRTLASIDAVTIDGFGTLLQLVDPIPILRVLAPGKSADEIRAALDAELEYYLDHSLEGRDDTSLAKLRADCTAVFNEALGTALTPDEYIGALAFEPLPGVPEALRRLRARGLALAVVANWDFGLHEHLSTRRLRHWFDTVVTAAEVGAKKPDPRPFREALHRLGVRPERAVHVGDVPAHDGDGAAAVGMHFVQAPLSRLLA